MATRAKIAWGLASGLVLLAGWWGLVPKIGTATEAEVRAHVAPELLQPLPHPEGGIARLEALQRALDKLPSERARPHQTPPLLDLADPAVREVIEILREGPLDRTHDIPPQRPYYTWEALDSDRYVRVLRVANGLTDAALQAANRGDWAGAGQHMEASCLLLDRLFESDARLEDRRWTISIEAKVYRTTLALAVHRDLPAGLAERLSALLVTDRHSPASLSQVLRGQMQYRVLPRIGTEPMSYYEAGTYDPLETAELVSARFLAMVRDAGLPAARRSGTAAAGASLELTGRYRWIGPGSRGSVSVVSYLTWPAQRIRLNTARNSIGRVDAATYPDGNLVDLILRARTGQDQAAAALAVARFRHRAGRDPRDFGELVTTGLLRAVPMDHAREQPLVFDLKTLFEWRAPRRY